MTARLSEAEARRALEGRVLERIIRKNVFDETCIVHRALNLIADKWTLLILLALLEGTKRHGELLRQIAGVSPKMLAQTLRALERNGLVQRRVFPEVPLRVEYSLTELGESLRFPLSALCEWAIEREPQLRHLGRGERPEAP